MSSKVRLRIDLSKGATPLPLVFPVLSRAYYLSLFLSLPSFYRNKNTTGRLWHRILFSVSIRRRSPRFSRMLHDRDPTGRNSARAGQKINLLSMKPR